MHLKTQIFMFKENSRSIWIFMLGGTAHDQFFFATAQLMYFILKDSS